MRKFTFIRLHIASGERWEREWEGTTWTEFYAVLNRWNREQAGVWQYWSKP